MRKILLWLTVIMWMGLIFKFSSQPAVQSSKLSGKVTNVNVKAIEKVKPNTKFNIVEFHHMVRKNAHFFIYLVLGILTLNALRKSEVKGYKGIIFALLICVIYAISDEIHQTFVPGRTGMVKDVFIDIAGATVGILGYIIKKCFK
ncbi:VanZ family protein [Clostridium novyi A str. 4552]|uniref:VanZ family protein n=1 Tax=Clostridium novyi A str. 4552 TaxID=1444289 RepID=A0A0A0I2H1_CLONO|nr:MULTISPECIES: VanZ family protein [Clostridium]KGM94526.1 VanZ family protein [Clostridium novyi A str. 4552]